MEDSTPDAQGDLNVGDEQSSQQQTQDTSADQQAGQQTQTPSQSNDNSDSDTPQSDQNDNDNQQNTDGTNQDELATWAEKQGIDLENPTSDQARTLAKRLRDTQKSFHEANSRAKQADTSKVGDLFNEDLTEEEEFLDPIQKELKEQAGKVNGQLSVLAFERFLAKEPSAEKYADKMIEILDQEEKTYGKTAARLLSNNHARLLTLAKSATQETDNNAAYDSGRQDERQNLAKAQQAAGPAANAISSAPSNTTVTDAAIGKMSAAEYQAWKVQGNNPWNVPAK